MAGAGRQGQLEREVQQGRGCVENVDVWERFWVEIGLVLGPGADEGGRGSRVVVV